MSAAHLSAITLDALELGELTGSAADNARAHLASCERCRADAAAATALHQQFRARVLPKTLPAIEARGRRARRWTWVLGLAAPIVVAAAVLIVLRARTAEPQRPELGIKGTAAMQVFARHGEDVIAVRDGTRLQPGDQMRFVVQPNGAEYLLVASVDGAGKASIYFPFDGSASAPLGPSARIELPGSIVLDATAGPERIFALFSREPLSAGAVKRELAAIGARGAEAIRSVRRLDAGTAEQATVVIEKVAP